MYGWIIVISIIVILVIVAVGFLFITPARVKNGSTVENAQSTVNIPVGSISNRAANADRSLWGKPPIYVDNSNYIKNLGRKTMAYYGPIFGGSTPVRFPCADAGSIRNDLSTYPVTAALDQRSGTWDIELQARYTMEQLLADLQARTYQDYGEYEIGINGKMIGGVIHGSFYPVENIPNFPTGIYQLSTSVGCKSKQFELIVVDFSQYQPSR